MRHKWRMGGATLVGVMFLAVSCAKEGEHHHANGDRHGTPKDWKFTLAKGSADEGRKVFVELQCYKCHEVKGEKFPDVAQTDKGVGPELSQMARHAPGRVFR